MKILTVRKKIPVFETYLDPDQWGLSAAVDRHREKYPETYRSNVNAWHSAWNTHLINSDFMPFVNTVLKMCEFVSSEYYEHPMKFLCSDMWVMQYEAGDSARLHAHYPSDFSCAYYIDAEEDCAPIVFEKRLYVTPEKGKLVIFPGILEHEVPKTKYKRTVISMNVNRYVETMELCTRTKGGT